MEVGFYDFLAGMLGIFSEIEELAFFEGGECFLLPARESVVPEFGVFDQDSAEVTCAVSI